MIKGYKNINTQSIIGKIWLSQFMNAPFSLTGIVFLTDDPCHLANFNLRSFLYSTGETKITRL